jgi:hypothetical protein
MDLVANRNCPYCDRQLDFEVSTHLDTCPVYNELDDFMSQHIRSDISDTIDISIELEEEPRSVGVSWEDEAGSSYSQVDFSESVYVRPDPPPEEAKNLRPPRRSTQKERGTKRPVSGKPTNQSNAMCPICYNEYQPDQVIPLVLPSCGHTVCDICLQTMSDTYYSLKCPVCRTQNFQGVETLPINYALLELADKRSDKDLCDQHGLEIVGFCRDEDVLLCGVCVFEHKTHASFLLSSPEAKAWANSKKKVLEEKESRLKKLQSAWEKANKSLKQSISSLSSEAQVHIAALKRTEIKLIEEVRQGTKACVRQIKEVVADKQLAAKQTNITQRLKQFQAEISRISSLRKNYEKASVVERLKVPKIPELETSPPSVKDCLLIVRQLNLEPDYEAAIQEALFPLKRSD